MNWRLEIECSEDIERVRTFALDLFDSFVAPLTAGAQKIINESRFHDLKIEEADELARRIWDDAAPRQ